MPLSHCLLPPRARYQSQAGDVFLGFCLLESRGANAYKYGGIVDDIPSRTIRVPGGHVGACFYRCLGAVTDEGFTYYGGKQRPANRLLAKTTRDPIFRLPDGTTYGTFITYGDRWHGYHRIALVEPGPRPGWEKIVRSGLTKVRVVLDVTKGRVSGVYLEVSK